MDTETRRRRVKYKAGGDMPAASRAQPIRGLVAKRIQHQSPSLLHIFSFFSLHLSLTLPYLSFAIVFSRSQSAKLISDHKSSSLDQDSKMDESRAKACLPILVHGTSIWASRRDQRSFVR